MRLMRCFATPRSVLRIEPFGHNGGVNLLWTGVRWIRLRFRDIFEAFFGGSAAGARQAPEKGATLQYNISPYSDRSSFWL